MDPLGSVVFYFRAGGSVEIVSPDEALQRLVTGNQRFVSGKVLAPARSNPEWRQSVAQTRQRPFAVILSCSDSRVPSEMIFDCGMGDLFIVRVAGNVVAPSLIGSVEFAALNFNTPLCAVVGHTRCGAVDAAITAMTSGGWPASDHIQNIVLEIAPAVKAVLKEKRAAEMERAALWEAVVESNVRHSVESLQSRSKVLQRLIGLGKFKVVGATYNLNSGAVSFLEP